MGQVLSGTGRMGSNGREVLEGNYSRIGKRRIPIWVSKTT